MNRLPPHLLPIATLAAVVALTASTAYWGLQLFKPQQRQIAVVPVQETPPPPVDAALGLFGGQATVATPASSYELRGVVAARNGRGSVAIIATSGETPKAYPVGKEVAPGLTVHDVQPRSVTLLEGGVQKRLDLLPDAGMSSTTAAPLPPMDRAAPPPPAPAAQPAVPSSTPMVTPPPGTPLGQAGQAAPVQTAPVQRPVTSQ